MNDFLPTLVRIEKHKKRDDRVLAVGMGLILAAGLLTFLLA